MELFLMTCSLYVIMPSSASELQVLRIWLLSVGGLVACLTFSLEPLRRGLVTSSWCFFRPEFGALILLAGEPAVPATCGPLPWDKVLPSFPRTSDPKIISVQQSLLFFNKYITYEPRWQFQNTLTILIILSLLRTIPQYTPLFDLIKKL